mgnify:CR=1 FL=1
MQHEGGAYEGSKEEGSKERYEGYLFGSSR